MPRPVLYSLTMKLPRTALRQLERHAARPCTTPLLRPCVHSRQHATPRPSQSPTRTYASISASELQFGQPVHETHPHILAAGELTPGITAQEYADRRSALSSLLDADLTEESAKITALQTQQQLAYQALAITNSSAQNVLRLFQ